MSSSWCWLRCEKENKDPISNIRRRFYPSHLILHPKTNNHNSDSKCNSHCFLLLEHLVFWQSGALLSAVLGPELKPRNTHFFCLFFILPTMEVRVSMLLQNCFLGSWLVVLLPGPPAGQMAGNSFYLLYNSTWGHGIRYAVKGRNGRKRNAQKKVLTKCLSVLLKILIWKFYFSDLATESFEEKKTTSKAIVSVINLTKDRI